MTRTLWAGLGAAAALLVTSCSAGTPDYQKAAINVIEGEIQETLGLGELTATCDEPPSTDVGTPFACAATTPDDQTIAFDAEIQEGHKVFVQKTMTTADYQDAATKVIEGEIQQTLALGELTPTCEEPSSTDIGSVFACTATTPDDDVVKFDAKIQEPRKVVVQSTNILTVENLGGIEAEAARILSEKIGQTLPAESIDCGSEPVIAAAGQAFVCALTDPGDPKAVYDASITLDDLANPTQLNVEVASAPRG